VRYLRRIMLGVMAVVALFVIATAVRQYRDQSEPSWTEFAFPQSNVTILMPVKSPKLVTGEVREGAAIEIYNSEWNRMRFSIARLPSPKTPTKEAANEFLDQFILAAKASKVARMQVIGEPHRIDLPGLIGASTAVSMSARKNRRFRWQ
jgi:hypothetical protein